MTRGNRTISAVPKGLVYNNLGTFFASRGITTLVPDYRRVDSRHGGEGAVSLSSLSTPSFSSEQLGQFKKAVLTRRCLQIDIPIRRRRCCLVNEMAANLRINKEWRKGCLLFRQLGWWFACHHIPVRSKFLGREETICRCGQGVLARDQGDGNW